MSDVLKEELEVSLLVPLCVGCNDTGVGIGVNIPDRTPKFVFVQ